MRSLVLVVAVVLALVLAMLPVMAISNGRLSSCDLTPAVGWASEFFPNGHVGFRTLRSIGKPEVTGPMAWVSRPAPTDKYTIRSADTALLQRESDPIYYTPGELTPIHVRAEDVRMRWTGLVMYATTEPGRRLQFDKDSNNIGYMKGVPQNHVGSWLVPSGAGEYQVTPSCQATVTHADASTKALHQLFYFSAPAGTGNVTFRILLKFGDQGRGSFLYPNRTLVLREAPAKSSKSLPTLCTPKAAPSAAAPCVNASTFYTWAQSPDVQPISTAVLGAPGSSCAATCAAQKTTTTPFCDATALRAISTAAALRSLTRSTDGATCRTQVLAACRYIGPPRIDPAGYCSYPAAEQFVASTCPPAVVAAAKSGSSDLLPADVCFTEAYAQASPLCICSSRADAQGLNPFLLAATKSAAAGKSSSLSPMLSSAATLKSASFSWTLLGAMGAASLAAPLQRSGLLMLLTLLVLCVASVTPVRAHNYLMSLQRATQASTIYPCVQRQGNQPHAQVIANQRFEIEWSNGHGTAQLGAAAAWFMILPASAYHQLIDNSRVINDIMLDYINSAPPSANVAGYGANMDGGNSSTPNGPLGPYQLGDQSSLRHETQRIIDESYFTNANLSLDDPARILREETYWRKFLYVDGKPFRPTQQQPLGKFTVKDRRVSYQSAKYPWIDSVHRFQSFYDQEAPGGSAWSSTAAIAQFAIRGWSGPGDYIAWYSWHGYYGCMDINLLPGDAAKGDAHVKNRYGKSLNGTKPTPTVVKTDHCEYVAMKATTQTHKLDPKTRDASVCINECKALAVKKAGQTDAGCLGVQVVRAKVAPKALAVNPWAIPNIPYYPYVKGSETCECPAEKSCSVQQRYEQGCRTVDPLCNQTALAPFEDDEHVCYGLLPGVGTGAQVKESWEVATEPEDPAWYSTCYAVQLHGDGGFIGIPPVETSVVPSWDFAGEHCVSCDFQQRLKTLNLTQVPNWVEAVAPVADGLFGGQQALGGGCVDCSIWDSDASAAVARSMLAGKNLLAVPSAQTEIGSFAPAQSNAEIDDPSTQPADGGSSGSVLPLGALIGIVAGAVVLLAVGIGAFYVRRQRSAWHKNSQGIISAQLDTQMVSNPALSNW